MPAPALDESGEHHFTFWTGLSRRDKKLGVLLCPAAGLPDSGRVPIYRGRDPKNRVTIPVNAMILIGLTFF